MEKYTTDIIIAETDDSSELITPARAGSRRLNTGLVHSSCCLRSTECVANANFEVSSGFLETYPVCIRNRGTSTRHLRTVTFRLWFIITSVTRIFPDLASHQGDA